MIEVEDLVNLLTAFFHKKRFTTKQAFEAYPAVAKRAGVESVEDMEKLLYRTARSRMGTWTFRSKLTDKEFDEIVELTYTQKAADVAVRYSVSESMINSIWSRVRNDRWMEQERAKRAAAEAATV